MFFFKENFQTEVTVCVFREPAASNDVHHVDLKRQLESVEQEASVLRTKVLSLEQDNEKMGNENKKLALHAARLSRKDSIGDKDKNAELVKLKDAVAKLEKAKEELENKLKTILDAPVDKLPQRAPKIVTENSSRLQLQVCVLWLYLTSSSSETLILCFTLENHKRTGR